TSGYQALNRTRLLANGPSSSRIGPVRRRIAFTFAARNRANTASSNADDSSSFGSIRAGLTTHTRHRPLPFAASTQRSMTPGGRSLDRGGRNRTSLPKDRSPEPAPGVSSANGPDRAANSILRFPHGSTTSVDFSQFGRGAKRSAASAPSRSA